MRKQQQRILAAILSFLLFFSTFSSTLYAEEQTTNPFEGMIAVSGEWKGSVFGDVGGQDKITSLNFGITENADGTVTLRSANDRGKIASGSEGIAYYFQEVAADADFELTATAHVDSWTANNQVSFGIMLRSNVLDNENLSSFSGDYVAAGALDQQMKAFYKENGAQVKSGFEFSHASQPGAGQQYELSIKKSGNLYLVKVGEDSYIIENNGGIRYAGLYTARNTTVTFSNVNLAVQPAIELGEWEFSAFGGNTSEAKNPDPSVHGDGSVTLFASGGKIASADEGVSFYYKEAPAEGNYEIAATATVTSFNNNSGISTPNQKSFGLMLRNQVGPHGDASVQTADYIAVGALDTVMKAFYKQGSQTKLPGFGDVNPPAAGEVYTLSIKKTGDIFAASVNGNSEIISLNNLFNDKVYIGFYVARDAEVTFSDFSIKTDARVPGELAIDTASMKTTYLIGEALDLSGAKVTAVTQDVYGQPRTEILLPNEYVVTGYDSSKAGPNEIMFHFKGLAATVTLQILELTLTDLEIQYFPAKTDYYMLDEFDPQGFTLIGTYNTGVRETLGSDKYVFVIPDAAETETGYVFESPGTKTVQAISTENPDMSVFFEVVVKDAAITGLEIRQLPEVTQYYIGDELDIDGLVVYAKYDDMSEVRLLRNEYTVSPLDASSPEDRLITVSHKGLKTAFNVNVKVKEVTHIEVSGYPKTTFFIGESFDAAGLTVSKVYDNSDREDTDEYMLDTTGYDNTKAGVYEILILPADSGIAPATLKVTVREQTAYEWKWIRFGQSISSDKNLYEDLGGGVHRLTALEGGGKVTGDHDGITYYYTVIDAAEDNFVLSADIKVEAYAKTPHDGQEGFGIMARDAIGVHNNSAVFASNIAAVGGHSGGTGLPNGTQLFVRTGVESFDGAGSKGIRRIMLNPVRPDSGNTHPSAPYRLTLAKTNSGFTGKLNNGTEEIIFEPDVLKVQDSKMYVGFFVARLATIEASNIEFTVTAAATDAPAAQPPKLPVAPEVEILSLERTSNSDYTFMARMNVDGVASLKQGLQVIQQDIPVQAGTILSVPAALVAQSNNNFSLTFIPDDTQLLTSYNKIVTNFTVHMKMYQDGGDIYVSPAGTSSGSGTQADPLDLDTAVDFVMPGQKIVVLAGHYARNSKLEIKKYNDGRADAMKYLVAAEGARPVIDFDKKTEGVVHSGNYWHVKGLDFTRSAGNTKGYVVGGNHNIIENSRFYANGDTGLQISRTDPAAEHISEWPSYNLILNGTSFDNIDPSENNADGFAAKLTVGAGNVFRGCIAHNNIDDGWDLYTKAGTGAVGAVLIEDSVAFNNGVLTNGYVGKGDKNGFKLGGEGIHVPHVIRNSMAFGNAANGFGSNSNPGVIAMNNIGFNNGRNLSFTTYSHIPEDFTIDGFVSYKGLAADNYPAALHADNNYMFDGSKSVNLSGTVLTDANFASLEPVTAYERDAEGNIIWGDFLKFNPPGSEPGKDKSKDKDKEKDKDKDTDKEDKDKDKDKSGS